MCGSSAPLLTGGVWRAQVLSQQGLPRRGQSGPQGTGDSLHRRLGGRLLTQQLESLRQPRAAGPESPRWDFGRRSADPCLLLGSTPSLARSRGSHLGLVLLSFSGTWLCVACGEQSLPALRSPDIWAKSKPVWLGGSNGGWAPAAESFRAERSYP